VSETAEEGIARRAARVARIRAETGLDEAMIGRVVEAFYGRVRADPLLAPVFAARVADWGPHLERMRRFWNSVALLEGGYLGKPMDKHRHLPVESPHFGRWLELFGQTAGEVCPPAAAALLQDHAARIARSLQGAVERAREAAASRPAP
jgi:hemoglobin